MSSNKKLVKGFINGEELEWLDIASEGIRTYGKLEDLKIENPAWLNVKQKSSGDVHRVITEEGDCYYINPAQAWYIKWIMKK